MGKCISQVFSWRFPSPVEYLLINIYVWKCSCRPSRAKGPKGAAGGSLQTLPPVCLPAATIPAGLEQLPKMCSGHLCVPAMPGTGLCRAAVAGTSPEPNPPHFPLVLSPTSPGCTPWQGAVESHEVPMGRCIFGHHFRDCALEPSFNRKQR